MIHQKSQPPFEILQCGDILSPITEAQAQHLAQAERYVVEGKQRVAHQMALIKEPAQGGHNMTDAKAFLMTLKQVLALIRVHMQLISDEIAAEAV